MQRGGVNSKRAVDMANMMNVKGRQKYEKDYNNDPVLWNFDQPV